MTNIVILGHGGYAKGIQGNLKMLMGDLDNFYYLDFLPEEDLEDFKYNLKELVNNHNLKQVVFICDLTGGSPFREACMLSLDNPYMQVVAGVNTAAITEISYMLDQSPLEIAKTCVEVTKGAVLHFSEDNL